ncbi:MAG: hypothetical protein H7210_03015 [Pyrinomonadaceae bacterium]|nr:hypothetical protein [Phycisphaerales bacterium]
MAESDAPIVVAVFDAGMGDPAARSSGIRLAVWDDGTVLTCTDPLHPDKDMRVGRLSPQQLAAGLRDLNRAEFFVHPNMSHVAPDSSYLTIAAKSKEGVRTHRLDTYGQSQVHWWPRALAALEKFRPGETRPVREMATQGQFRGFVVDEWWRTPWRR